jgi:hypothetical protein
MHLFRGQETSANASDKVLNPDRHYEAERESRGVGAEAAATWKKPFEDHFISLSKLELRIELQIFISHYS